ncbi:hypothetical protein D9757_000387 [Collybiopsis confluens]|uniref:MARVEL domain-containing protein n=1 Tax=Collybiopsis confluens TaxID=2823264 RepID=A0A8H5I270_9AGAR|nr:hypothetical protein D9757_000387 [Collybiopsis confluens]
MPFLPIMRLIVFVGTLVCSVIVLALSAHFTSTTTSVAHIYFPPVAVALFTALLSIITLSTMLGLEYTQNLKGTFTSKVLTEIVWIFILWTFWVSSAASLAEYQPVLEFDFLCEDGFFAGACQEYSAIEAFSFLPWFALLSYDITLFIHAILCHNRGVSPWFTPVQSLVVPPPSAAPNPQYPVDPQYPMGTGGPYVTNTTYPPQQQYPSMGVVQV